MDQFPFPAETKNGGVAAPATLSDPGSATQTDAPQAPAQAPNASGGKGDAGKDFPFPGDATPGSGGGGVSGSGSGSSSSSADDASPAEPASNPDGTPALKDKGSEGAQANQGRRLLHRVNPIGTKLQSPDEREAEDLDIAHYYTQTGDLQGALLRAQDAVKTTPDDPEAHFALAEVARKMNKRDLAIAEYTACLKLDAIDKEAKTARRELDRLKP